MLLLLSGFISGQAAQPDSAHLIILHTNDTHSRIDPIEASAKRYADQGGVLRREAAIRQIRQEAKKKKAQVLLLDAGNFVQGTPYFNYFDGKIEVGAVEQRVDIFLSTQEALAGIDVGAGIYRFDPFRPDFGFGSADGVVQGG